MSGLSDLRSRQPEGSDKSREKITEVMNRVKGTQITFESVKNDLGEGSKVGGLEWKAMKEMFNAWPETQRLVSDTLVKYSPQQQQ
jgi:hypothetical protein